MTITKNIGMLLLATYLILIGLMSLVPMLSGLGAIPAIISVAAGVAILIGK